MEKPGRPADDNCLRYRTFSTEPRITEGKAREFRRWIQVQCHLYDVGGGDEATFEQVRLVKAVGEFDPYIRANADRIPNYGERHRAGETISSSFVESAANRVISKRMVKKQQMRWTPRGAHLLLQIRTRVLNDELPTDFHRWYPGFAHTADRQALAA